ncbi:hypothetical protein MJD09_09170 [bacterium]|nr:hypothetical protein [bacterium]
MKCSAYVLVLTFIAAASHGDVYAQLSGLPVAMSPKETPQLTTLVFHNDFGLANKNIGDFKLVAWRTVWNPAKFSVLLGAGALLAEKGQADDGLTVATAIGYDVRSGSGQPWKAIIQLKGGLGYTKISDFKQWNIPIGFGAGWYLPPPKFNGKVWGSPRLHIRVSDEPGGSNSTEVGFGLSAGIAITTLKGPGVHLDFEWLRIDEHSELLLAIGFHWDVPIL